MKTKINSLGIEKDPKDTKVFVAMSGGVDSSTVAGLMKKEGYKVTGITLKLYDDSKQVAKSKQCCSGQDIMDAKRVANKLDIDNPRNHPLIDLLLKNPISKATPLPPTDWFIKYSALPKKPIESV